MTDYCDRFFLFIEAADKLLCPRVDPDRVGIQRSTGEKHGIEVSRIGLIECQVNIELIGFVVVLHRIYFACLGRLVPEAYRFAGRSRQPARDGFNAMLNYCNGVFYSLVERACICA